MSDVIVTNSDNALGSIKATQDRKVASERELRQMEQSKVDAPSPLETMTESSVRLSDAVDTTVETISPQRMGELIRELEEKLTTTSSKGLKFRMDEVLDKQIVSVIDKESGEILRQLPPEEVVRAARNIEYMRGLLFDDRS